jgi:hypothetical protein
MANALPFGSQNERFAFALPLGARTSADTGTHR